MWKMKIKIEHANEMQNRKYVVTDKSAEKLAQCPWYAMLCYAMLWLGIQCYAALRHAIIRTFIGLSNHKRNSSAEDKQQ